MVCQQVAMKIHYLHVKKRSWRRFQRGHIKKKIMCNSLTFPGSSVYDLLLFLKSNVSDWNADIAGKHDTTHYVLLTTSCRRREFVNQRWKQNALL